MALKGSIVKEEVMNKILKTFEGSFKYDKEIRIPMIENGELVQLKCVLTCAKVNVEPNGDVAIPGVGSTEINFGSTSGEEKIVEATEEEKATVARLAKMLDL
jgi:hypothetical protein